MLRDELKRQAKVVDMMLTMHSILGSRYQLRSQIFEIAFLVSSTLVVAFTFVDASVLSYLSISNEGARILIGVCSILLFVLSIVSLIVNWKGKATEHKNAFTALIPLKSEWREILSADNLFDERAALEFSRKSALIVG